ncbi:MAG: ribulose-phosphate 3-epimerase [Sulfurovum sp. PC08-66]|nr:MAG: ribulose-phosphate 3-epimerase [Sulfurovum sp. PC08-66]KIM12504.1 MAG: ribulose-phosphate 3-epimerase [Sulfuricurvum sp. PC08-66]
MANTEKAYKLVALQEGISNAKAKDLIDRGLVFCSGKKVKIARGELDIKSEFRIDKIAPAEVLFEDENIIAINKPAFVNSEEVVKKFHDVTLLHRLDKETSGVLLLTKNEEFRLKAIEAFKNDAVYKEYIAWVEGVVVEEMVIDKPIKTTKGAFARSNIDRNGKSAKTEVYPVLAARKRSKIKLVIHQGRTHQIRVHLRSVGHSVVGDTLYGGMESDRVMLHSHIIKLFDYTFEAPEPKIFRKFE